MAQRTRDFIDALGGYRQVAHRIGRPVTTVHGWIAAEDGRFPSHLYRAFCTLADEAGVPRPETELFRFLAVPPAPEEGGAGSTFSTA